MNTAIEQAPWASKEFFPILNPDRQYGYQQKNSLIFCSKDELIQKIEEPKTYTPFITTPSSIRLQTAYEAYEVTAEITQQIKNRTKEATFQNFGYTALLAIFLLPKMPSHLAIFIGAMFFLPIIKDLWVVYIKKPSNRWLELEDQTLRFTSWIADRTTFIWKAIALSIAIVGAEQYHIGQDSIQLAGLVKQSTRDGEYWRLSTCCFLHGSLFHFIFNMLALLQLAEITEKLYTKHSLIISFTLSCLAGSLASLYYYPTITSIGASGGILGILGFLLGASIKFKDLIPKNHFWEFFKPVVYIILMGIIARDIIDNAAHIGGLLMGFSLSFCLQSKQDFIENKTNAFTKALTIICSLLLIAGFIFTSIKVLLPE